MEMGFAIHLQAHRRDKRNWFFAKSYADMYKLETGTEQEIISVTDASSQHGIELVYFFGLFSVFCSVV